MGVETTLPSVSPSPQHALAPQNTKLGLKMSAVKDNLYGTTIIDTTRIGPIPNSITNFNHTNESVSITPYLLLDYSYFRTCIGIVVSGGDIHSREETFSYKTIFPMGYFEIGDTASVFLVAGLADLQTLRPEPNYLSLYIKKVINNYSISAGVSTIGLYERGGLIAGSIPLMRGFSLQTSAVISRKKRSVINIGVTNQ